MAQAGSGHSMWRALLLGVALGLVWSAGCDREADTDARYRVEADGEVLEGKAVTGEVVAFKGIPYAAAPIGELRWRPPQRAEPRSGVQPANEFGPACPQTEAAVQSVRELAVDFGQDPALVPDLGPTSEDCLHLNVWTPSVDEDARLPVMVWIHGGSNIWGSSSDVPYDGANLARRGVVVVSLNYRLGLLGFMAHPALTGESAERSSGNYGLLDQVAALEWVQRNIAGFGGDPSRVTLFGGSTGGANVLYLMASPLAEGLFHRAISQSGAPPADLRKLDAEEVRGSRVEELLAVGSADDPLSRLRETSVERLVEISTDHLNRDFDSAPVADGWALRDHAGRVFADGRQADVPLLIGSNADEWANLGRYAAELTSEGYLGWLRSRWGAQADRAARIYRAPASGSVEPAVRRWQTDVWFACPARFVARGMEAVTSEAYLYQFTRRLPGAAGERMGAFHGAEVAYVFDNLAAESWLPRGGEDQRLADALVEYWVEFARSGRPAVEGLPEWPAYRRSEDGYLELGDEIVARTGLHAEACGLWEERLERALNGG
jgi:para-nitrobenzyl esterase